MAYEGEAVPFDYESDPARLPSGDGDGVLDDYEGALDDYEGDDDEVFAQIQSRRFIHSFIPAEVSIPINRED